MNLSEIDLVQIGDEWIYRLRDSEPSERVLVLAKHPKKTSFRVTVRFLDGTKAGDEVEVPGGRLRGLWSEVEAFDKYVANWQRLDVFELSDLEDRAVTTVMEVLIPGDVAEAVWNPVRNALVVHDAQRFEALIGMPIDAFASGIPHFLDGDELTLSPAATLYAAELACKVAPKQILDQVAKEERSVVEQMKESVVRRSLLTGEEYTVSPQQQYDEFIKWERPVHEVIREWCGYKAIGIYERLEAAEQESRRLEDILSRALEALVEAGLEDVARWFREEVADDRITPERVRTVVSRPLKPSEIPVIEVSPKRRWGR